MAERWTPYATAGISDGFAADMTRDDEGDWVRYSDLERVEAERDKLKEPGRFVPLDTRTQYEESLERSLSDVEAELKQMERERNAAERETLRLQNKLLNVRNTFGESEPGARDKC